jgi:hypothetical protein
MTKKQTHITVKIRDYGDDEVNRLALVGVTLERMGKEERARALRFFKSKYSADWPTDSY